MNGGSERKGAQFPYISVVLSEQLESGFSSIAMTRLKMGSFAGENGSSVLDLLSRRCHLDM